MSELWGLPQRPADESEFTVYAIDLGVPGMQVVKIGWSRYPSQRMKQFRACKLPWELRTIWETRGGFREEQLLHEAFRARRLGGEWFSFAPAEEVPSLLAEALGHGLAREADRIASIRSAT